MAQMNVNLAFSADTGKAKAQIAELQSLLSKIAYTGSTANTTNILQKDLQEASTAAKELQFHLNNAFNVSTGKFDLSMLDKSLKTSGSNITDLSTKLLGAGATGQQAFATLAQSISLADQPMLRVSKRMQEFAVTMKNTVKWQLSSSMLHGFMGAIQSAYGYAQDLNKSLTDIRIVTGYSTDQMAQFAEQANKAAKALSTTTTDYTNASLIYFQQGLSDAEVAARTDITVKMANAAGQSAEIVSEQLTAVWNNFADGSKSLEYYADVMTALGAATASSSDEISEGLSKFSAVAESVGLSYEYATAALTTITSNTRESADIVGNALKTLFARLQGLKLGETLEDGVDLNKYSEALDKVGISIFQQNGELKAMDTILDEMAAKWGTLSNTQQVALAQTVAGVRQYNQLIALMENWDNGDEDSMMANLKTIENADGALQKQADIYAQSWEAAQKRVQAAAEGIYQSLLDDDFFISINNGFANLLGGLDAFIDGAGGVKTVLLGISSIIVSSFANKIPEAIDNVKYNLKVLTKGTEEAYKDIQNQMNEATEQAFKGILKDGTKVEPIKQDSALGYQITAANDLTAARSKLALVSDKMSASEQQMANTQLSIIERAQQEVVALKEKNDRLKESIALQEEEIAKIDIGKRATERISTGLLDDTALDFKSKMEQFKNDPEDLTYKDASYEIALDQIKSFAEQFDGVAEKLSEKYKQLGEDMYKAFSPQGKLLEGSQGIKLDSILNPAEVDEIINKVKELGKSVGDLDDISEMDAMRAMRDEISALSSLIPPAIQEATGLKKVFDNIASASHATNIEDLVKEIDKLPDVWKKAIIQAEKFEEILGSKEFLGNNFTSLIGSWQNLNKQEEEVVEKTNLVKNLLDEFKPTHIVRTSEALGALGGMLGEVVTVATSAVSIFKALADPDLSGWEKFSAILSGVSIIIPTTLSAMSQYATIKKFIVDTAEELNKELGKEAILSKLVAATDKEAAISKKALGKSTREYVAALTDEQKKEVAGILSNLALAQSEGKLTNELKEEALAKLTTIFMGEKKNSTQAKAIAGNLIEAATEQAVEKSLWGVVKAKLAAHGITLLQVAAIAALIAVVVALIALFAHLHTSQAEANEKIADANAAYEEEKNKLDELKSSLESVQDAIDELASKDTLTITEEEELAKLREQEASLERQIALQEKLANLRQSEAAQTFEENAEKASQWINSAPSGSREFLTGGIEYTDAMRMSDASMGIYRTDTQMLTPEEYKARYLDPLNEQMLNLDKNSETYEEDLNRYKNLYDQKKEIYNNWVKDNEAAQADYIDKYQESQNELIEGYKNWLAQNPTASTEEKNNYTGIIAAGNRAFYGDDYEKIVYGSMEKSLADEEKFHNKDFGEIITDSYNNGNIGKTGEEIAALFSDSFKNSLYTNGIIPEEYADYLVKQYKDKLNKVDEQLKEEGSNLTMEDIIDDERWSDEDLDILTNIEITGEDDLNSIFEKIEAYKSNIVEVDFNLNTWKKDYSSKMDVIKDLESGDTISAKDYALLGDEYTEYFQVQADGTAILIAKAEELKAAAEGIEIGELKNNIQARQDAIDNLESNEILYNETYNGLNYGRTAEFSDLHAIAGSENGFNETQSGQEIAYIEAVNTALGKNYETAQEAYAGYEAFKTSLSDEQGVMATTASSLNELNEMLQSNLITAEDYNNVFKGTIYKEASDLGIDLDELAEYADYLEEIGNLTEENALKAALAEKKQSKAADDLIDNYKDYVKVLKKADLDSKIKATEEYSKVIQSLKKDLSLLTGYEEEAFSDEFINSSAVQQALLDISNGVEGATEKLQALAALEMLPKDVTVKLDEASYNELVQALADVSEDIEIGTTINNSNALLQLGALMEQAGYTVEQIQAAFNKLGWSPTIDYETIDVSDAENYVSNGFVQVVTGDMLSGYNVKNIPLEAINSVATNGTVRIPKIGSAGGGGGAPSTPSFTKIDNPGNGSTKKPGGGGGGSKPKHAEKKNDSDKERYHTLNNQLEDLESQYDSISDAADRAFGQDKLDNIDKQIEKTQELIDKNEEYLAEAEKNASIDKSVMEAYYNKSIGGPAIQYDENGNITNFDEIQDAAYAKYNQMAETYDEESNEWIQFEKDYEQFMKYLELYEESTDLVRDKKAEAERLAAEKIDLELEKVQYSIEIQLEVPEDQLKVIDFQLERIEDDAFNSAESMNLLIQKANLFNREIETTKQGLIDTLGVTLSDQEINQILSGDMDGIDTSKFTEDQVSAIREYKDSLLELNQELLDIQQQIEDEVMETFEEYHEELDRGMEKFDHYNNMLESYQNIVDIVGKDVLGLDNEALADISEAQVENSINQLKASKDAYDSLQKQADDALQKQQEAEMKAALARAKGDEETAKSYEEDAEFWKETYTEMNEAAVEAQEEMMDNWGNTLEAIATQFELAVERAVEVFNDAIYEFGGLEGMSDDFSRQKEMDDMYLEDYQQIYELSKLTRDINNTIDDTENIAGKQKLKKLLEEINQLQEDGVEMSEYDLEYLQAEYNLRLAELELEEAQKAKDTVRLSRDNEGNWSYVYTQNTDAVDAAQQKYEDALYAMQDLSSNYIDEMSEQLIATSQEMQEALANVRVEDFASQEEYYAELARIEAQYQEQMAAQEAELNKAIANNKELYDTDWKNYSEATGYKISAAEEFATKFSDTLLGSLIGSEEATSNFTAIVGEATDSLVQGLANAAATYYTNLNTAMEAAGTSTSEFADLLAEDVEAIKADSKEAADAVADMAKKMDEEMTKITERVQKFQEDYGREIDKIIAKNLEMVETFNDMLEHLSIDPDQINVTYDISRSQDGEDGETVEVPEGTASGYTGMYTGDWDSKEGRVAVLHEKELLLNQDDTVNMLEALKVSKYMLEILNANTQMMSQGMGSLFPASVDNSVSEILEQQVSIVAEFPNAVNHSEIEEAFDTLINRAAQYANRK